MIGLLIFAVGIMAVYGMQLQSMQLNNYSRRLTEASNAARQKMEELKGKTYDDFDLADTNGNGKAGLDAFTAQTADKPGVVSSINGYPVYWNIAKDDPWPDTKTVHVIATWNWRGEVKRVTYRTIIAK